MILYKITVFKTGKELFSKDLIREIQDYKEKHYITQNSKSYEVDKDSLMISFDSGKTWDKPY